MIRKACLADIPQIQSIARIAFPETYRAILSTQQIDYMMEMMYSTDSLTRQMTVEKQQFLIEDGKGYVSFRHEGPDEDGRDVFHLEKLYVLPQCQGTGLGRKLISSVMESVKGLSKGPARIELNVNRYNSAVSFYEHIGMHKARSGDFPIGDGFFMNDYIMAVDL